MSEKESHPVPQQQPQKQTTAPSNQGSGPDNGSKDAQASKSRSGKIDMTYLVRALVKYNASDLHLKVGRPPLYRINGKLVPAKMPKMEIGEVEEICRGILSEKHRKQLEESLEVDFSFRVKELGRFRCNIYHQRGTLAAAVRMIPLTVPQLNELGVPSVIKDLCNRPRGLILVTGPTGAGKSTTLAAMIQYINEHKHAHILTLEDPIEFIFRDAKASITQRELGSDTHSFQSAMKSGLRQDPDIIMVGELRDREVIEFAMTAAETGHLVLSTLHTNDAKSSVERLLDVFPAEAQNQMRIQLASTLVGVISQNLLVRADGTGRVPACEVMVKSPTVENLISKNEIGGLQEAISKSTDYYKMQTMNQSLLGLIKKGLISEKTALKASNYPDDLRLLLSGIVKEEGFRAKSA